MLWVITIRDIDRDIVSEELFHGSETDMREWSFLLCVQSTSGVSVSATPADTWVSMGVNL